MAHKTTGQPMMKRDALAKERSWAGAMDAAGALLRPAYLAEVEQLAESLRPRFQGGELRGFTDADGERELRDKAWKAPAWKLEDACAAWFRLTEADAELDFEATFRRAALVRLGSPGDAYTDANQPTIGQAVIAIACDVVALARARGWYVPAADECPAEEFTRWAREAA